jgi:hypothetical protein
MKKSILKGIGVFALAASLILSGCSNITVSESNSESAVSAERAASTASGLSTGTISSNTTYGDFTLLATSSKTVKVVSSSASYGGTSYSKAWDLGGGADGVAATYRAFKVSLNSGDTVKAVVNANSARTLQFSNGSKVVASADVGTSASQFSYTATASGTYYLYSKSSAMRVFSIEKTSSSSSSSGSSSSGSSSSGSSSSGSSSSTSDSAISFKPTSLSAGSVTSSTTYGSFQVLASSDKPVAIVNSSLSYNSNSYTKALDLKGGFAGTKPTYRAVKFDAASGATISVVAKAGATRTLQLSDGSSVLKSVSVGTSATLLSYTTTKSGTYYVYSSGSAISIYEIYVSAAGSSSSSSGSSSSGSSSSGSSSSGSSSSGSSSSSSGSGLSNTGSTTQSGVGTRSRLTEITNKSQIKSYIYCTSASEITSAINSVAGGAAVVIKAGTYKFSSPITISSSNNGSSSAMKYVMAEPGSANKVIFDFSGESLSDSNRGIQIFGDYWHFYGINVTGAGDNGMYIGGNNNIVELCVFYANRDSGLQIAREKSSMSSMSDWPSNNLILNCTAYDNADPATGENADGFACKLTCGNGNVFDGCIAYCNCDDGWDLYAKEATGSIGVVTIKNCVAYNNGRLTTNSSYANGDMNGFKLGGSNGKVPTAHVVTNCLAVGNGHDGFTDNGNGGALNVSYCTSYGNAKVNFNFYRTNKGKFDHMLTLAPKSSDKYGTSSVASTISNSVYFTNSKYYYISSAASITNGQKDFSTTISAPSTTATSLACNSSVHTSYRNADGTIKLSGYTNSSYSGHSFGSQAATVKGISLK